MDAFESVVALVLRRQGFWTATSYKVELSSVEKRRIGRQSSPRWEIDVVAYQPKSNEILAVECKSYLDSPGVTFDGKHLQPAERYKLFEESRTRAVVLRALASQLGRVGLCRPRPKVTLCLAAGRLRPKDDQQALKAHFARNGWRLIAPDEIVRCLQEVIDSGYENDTAFVVAKLLGRGSRSNRDKGAG